MGDMASEPAISYDTQGVYTASDRPRRVVCPMPKSLAKIFFCHVVGRDEQSSPHTHGRCWLRSQTVLQPCQIIAYKFASPAAMTAFPVQPARGAGLSSERASWLQLVEIMGEEGLLIFRCIELPGYSGKH